MKSLWDLIQEYIDDTGATEAAIMRKANLNKGAFTAWRARGVPSLPTRQAMFDLAAALKVDYDTVLNAILYDTAYLPEGRARAEQERIDAAMEELRDAFTKRLEEHVQWLLEDHDGDIAKALDLNHELRMDGSIDPSLADEAEEVLNKMQKAALTKDDVTLAAHDEAHSIEDEQDTEFP